MSHRLKLLFVLAILSCSSRVHAANLTTGNRFVTALVEDQTGHIWFLRGNSAFVPPSIQLSYRNKSFLSVRVGAKVYSNNDVSSIIGQPDVMLGNGRNSKIGDTIETVWKETGFDIIQDVYPVAFEISGQIIYSIRIVNHAGASLSVQTQYLLDVDVNSNDEGPVATRYDYTSNRTQYPNANRGIPPFFLEFQKSSSVEGAIGTAYVSDELTPFPIGLFPPSLLAVVDWMKESDYAWGLMPGAPWGVPYKDNAMFYEWPATSVAGSGKDTILEIARGSYGTGEFEICNGNLLAITLYPHRVKYNWKNHKYFNNPFEVESFIFNTSSSADATKARASLTISALKPPGSMRIVSPPGAIALADGSLSQTQDLGTIPKLQMAEVHWLDSTLDVVSATGDSAATISLNCTYAGLPPPAFITPCDMPIVIETINTDTSAPKVSATGGSSIDSLFLATDSSLMDTGLRSINWTAMPASNATVSITWATTDTSIVSPTTFPCVMQPVAIHLSRKDTNIATCVDFTVIDCNNNPTHQQICWKNIDLSPRPDSLPPVFTLRSRLQRSLNPDTNCNAGFSTWTVTESRTFDEGLASVSVVPGSGKNLTFHLSSPIKSGDRSAVFQVSVLDSTQNGSIIIVASDSVTPHHIAYDTITYCAAPVGSVPLDAYTVPISISVHPNPSAGNFSLSLDGLSERGMVEVLDILGRHVDSFVIDSRADWDASRLNSGTYILRVTLTGTTLSKRIIKE